MGSLLLFIELWSAWASVIGFVYIFVILGRITLKLPMLAIILLALPIMPFVSAYRNRVEHPIQAKIICYLWGVIYAILFIVCLTC